MHNPTLIKTFVADGAISKDRFVTLAVGGGVSQASSSSAYILGTTDRLGAADQDKVDVILQGIAEVEAGESITAPAAITVNASGQAVVATSGAQVAGLAITSAAAGEVVSVLLGSYAPIAAAQDGDGGGGDDVEPEPDEPQTIDVADETVTYSTDDSAFVLAHSPVVEGSLTVKSADGQTTYVADTDYAVTLATGKITSIEGTTMTFAEGATIKASYQYTAST